MSSDEPGPFNPEVTIVATGLRYSQNENVMEKAKSLVKDGLGLDTEIVNAMHIPYRNDKPGILKVEFRSLADKIEALKAKKNLLNNNDFKRVHIRSSQSHVERLLHLNTKTLLKVVGAEDKFRVTGSGRLIPKERADDAQNGRQVDSTGGRGGGNRR